MYFSKDRVLRADDLYQALVANGLALRHRQGSGVFRTYGSLSGMYGYGAESYSCEHGHAT